MPHVRGACIAFPSSSPTGPPEQVRLYSILMEDVRELKEFVVKHCRVVCFSGGGQYFSFAHNAQVPKVAILSTNILSARDMV